MIATIGFFDGVHEGHRFLLRQLVSEAKRCAKKSMVITFKEHPRIVLRKDYNPELLTTNSEKVSLIKQLGVDEVVFIEFTEEFQHLTAQEFMRTYLREQLGVSKLLVGYDHHFGCNQNESFHDYERYGKELGIEVILCEGHKVEDAKVSSTMVRKALNAGEMRLASQLLGYDYQLNGVVVSGRKVGRRLGFPTANLQLECEHKLVPPLGVYAVWAIVEGKNYPAVLNIGRRPTLDNGDDVSIEVHLFHFEGELYERELSVTFVVRMRDEMCFPSLEALQEQIQKDSEMAQCILFDSDTH